jgi:hypothetical protein
MCVGTKTKSKLVKIPNPQDRVKQCEVFPPMLALVALLAALLPLTLGRASQILLS